MLFHFDYIILLGSTWGQLRGLCVLGIQTQGRELLWGFPPLSSGPSSGQDWSHPRTVISGMGWAEEWTEPQHFHWRGIRDRESDLSKLHLTPPHPAPSAPTHFLPTWWKVSVERLRGFGRHPLSLLHPCLGVPFPWWSWVLRRLDADTLLLRLMGRGGAEYCWGFEAWGLRV